MEELFLDVEVQVDEVRLQNFADFARVVFGVVLKEDLEVLPEPLQDGVSEGLLVLEVDEV